MPPLGKKIEYGSIKISLGNVNVLTNSEAANLAL